LIECSENERQPFFLLDMTLLEFQDREKPGFDRQLNGLGPT
jgi:hypothetical protein